MRRLRIFSIPVGIPIEIVDAIVLVAMLMGCNKDSGTTPDPIVTPPVVVTPPPPAAPTLACPSPISATTTGAGSAVSYAAPSADGGQSPVNVECSPASGSTFPIGSTEVHCTASDALNRSASCVFPITVSRLATISKTKFVAFGDSITVGVVATDNPSPPPPFILTDVPNQSYPTVLRQLLAARYSTQTITVLNEGLGGQKAVDAVGRAFSTFNATRPDAALILIGFNDLSNGGEQAIDPAIAAINDMAKDARFRGARVFLATLTPPIPNSNKGIGNITIVRFNEKLKAMARGENAVLVDLYAAMAGDAARYNSADGRHLTVDGYRKVAETFFAAIQAEFENK